jgi:hypothetical protein
MLSVVTLNVVRVSVVAPFCPVIEVKNILETILT